MPHVTNLLFHKFHISSKVILIILGMAALPVIAIPVMRESQLIQTKSRATSGHCVGSPNKCYIGAGGGKKYGPINSCSGGTTPGRCGDLAVCGCSWVEDAATNAAPPATPQLNQNSPRCQCDDYYDGESACNSNTVYTCKCGSSEKWWVKGQNCSPGTCVTGGSGTQRTASCGGGASSNDTNFCGRGLDCGFSNGANRNYIPVGSTACTNPTSGKTMYCCPVGQKRDPNKIDQPGNACIQKDSMLKVTQAPTQCPSDKCQATKHCCKGTIDYICSNVTINACTYNDWVVQPNTCSTGESSCPSSL